MKQISSEWLKVLGKGMITIPKAWRDELGIKEGEVIRAEKIGGKVVIQGPIQDAPYRVYSDEEIEQWLKEDQIPQALTSKLNHKFNLK